MATQTKYCNTTTDLRRAYASIDDMQWRGLRVIATKALKNYSTSVFKISGVGNVEAMYEDGVKMALAASLGDVDTAQEWFYDSANDALYFQPTGAVFANHEYRYGEDWDTVKTDFVLRASRDAESYLDKDVPVPIPPSMDGDAAHPYDLDFSHAVAKIACGMIMDRIQTASFDVGGNPTDEAAQSIFAGRSIIKEYASHARRFSWEITADEIGGHNIRPASTNTSAGIIQLRGLYTPTTLTSSTTSLGSIFPDPFWKVKISTGGVLGTAQYQLSTDNGTTYGTASATSNQWAHLSNNVWIRFIPRLIAAGDYVANDTWQLEIQAPDKSITNPSLKSIQVSFS